MRTFFALKGLASTAETQNRIDDAARWYLEAVAERQGTGSEAAELVALLDLGQLYSRHRRLAESSATLGRIAEIWLSIDGSQSLGAARYLSEQADALNLAGDHVRAEEGYRRALAIVQQRHEENSAFAAEASGRLAGALAAQGKVEEAAKLCQSAISNLEKLMGGTMYSVGLRRQHATLLRRQNRESEAEQIAKSGPAPKVVNVGTPRDPGLTPPQNIGRTEPGYSDLARRKRLAGSILVYFEIDESGRTSDVQVMRPLGVGLDKNAMEAVLSWRFRPATKEGKPVRYAASAEVNFRLL
ncbi:MAG: TonB family protein [Bryobacteraceae bacterium]|nr:TonB family protein [Bryobacteraceae bacterium]